MIIGAHAIIFSKDPEADRAFLRDVFQLPYVDDGDGWLIFGLPPAEAAVHRHRRNNVHQLYFMCADIEVFLAEMKQLGITCDELVEAEWGLLTYVSLPGGGKLGVYQPRHARPASEDRP